MATRTCWKSSRRFATLWRGASAPVMAARSESLLSSTTSPHRSPCLNFATRVCSSVCLSVCVYLCLCRVCVCVCLSASVCAHTRVYVLPFSPPLSPSPLPPPPPPRSSSLSLCIRADIRKSRQGTQSLVMMARLTTRRHTALGLGVCVTGRIGTTARTRSERTNRTKL